jgi:hypothetical protein
MTAWRVGEASVRVIAIRMSDFSRICILGGYRDKIPGSDDAIPCEDLGNENNCEG